MTEPTGYTIKDTLSLADLQKSAFLSLKQLNAGAFWSDPELEDPELEMLICFIG